jgi:RNA polymerase sigma-70 factor, ECF subfamily
LIHTPTELLAKITRGDKKAFGELFEVLYSDFRRIARINLERHDYRFNKMSSTELVHEAFVKLIDADYTDVSGKTHFLMLGSKVMRHVMVDRARKHFAMKRGEGVTHLPLEEDQLSRHEASHVLKVEEALTKLQEMDPEQAKIVEMRFFGGMTVSEVAESLGRSKRWVEAEWTMIRAWLRAELKEVP